MRPSKDGSVVVCYYQDWVKAQCQERGEKGERKGEGEREQVGGHTFPRDLDRKTKNKNFTYNANDNLLLYIISCYIL